LMHSNITKGTGFFFFLDNLEFEDRACDLSLTCLILIEINIIKGKKILHLQIDNLCFSIPRYLEYRFLFYF